MSRPEPPYRHVALCVAPTDAAVGDAIAAATSWLRGDPRVTFTAVFVAPARPVLRGGLTGWEVDTDDPLRPVREWLEEASASFDADPVVLEGSDPPAELARWAAGAGVDLLVAAASSSLVQRIALGSFTAGLAGHSDVPVLVVPPGAGEAAGEWTPRPPRRIVCCVDPSPAAAAAVEECRRLVSDDPDIELTLLHAVVPPRLLRPRWLRQLLPAPRWRVRREYSWLKQAFSGVPNARRALTVGAGRDVAAWAERHPADLIVTGARGAHTMPRIIGGFAHDLSLHARAPVLLVPPWPLPEPGR